VDDEAAFLGPLRGSGVDYSGRELLREQPVLPFITWGLDFPEEMLFEFASHPVYGMVEVTQVRARDGQEEWFALVSERSGVQHAVVGSVAAAELARSFPAPVWEGGLEVVAIRTESRLQYRAQFTLPTGEKVDALITSSSRGSELPKRNGNAMNHSQDTVLAVLDLEEFNWASAEVKVDGKRSPIRQLAPFVPFAWRLEQAAGGLGSGGLWMAAEGAAALPAEREPSGESLQFEIRQAGEQLLVVQRDALLETTWRFENGGHTDAPLELREVEVLHGEVSVFRQRMNPALPDLRYGLGLPFEGRLVAGSNGRDGYMMGTIRAHEDKGDVVVDVLPESPAWACERPVRNRLSYLRSRAELGGSTGVRLRASIEPDLAAGGQGRAACW